MKIDIKELKENGFIVTKTKNGQDRIKKEDGRTFNVWAGEYEENHLGMPSINEVIRRKDEVSIFKDENFIGTIFNTKEIGIFIPGSLNLK